MKRHSPHPKASHVIWLSLLALGLSSAGEAGEGRVQLELYGERGQSALTFQQWAQALGKAGIRNVRIQSGQSAKPGVEVRGTKESPLYVVTGIIRGRDDLILSSGRFKQRDASRIARWLDDLAKQGPESERPQRGAFGLTSDQFAAAHHDLAQPVGFATSDMTRRQVVERIARRLKSPLRSTTETREILSADKAPIAEDLSAVSCGTTVAYVLRPVGLCLVPRVSADRVEYVIAKSRGGMEIWPIGWESKKLLSKVAPTLAEFHNVNVQRVSAEAAGTAIAKQAKIPIFWDQNAMARHGVDPSQVAVSHPRKRTTYLSALRTILFQAKLKVELRVDEADNPLLWVSTIKPIE